MLRETSILSFFQTIVSARSIVFGTHCGEVAARARRASPLSIARAAIGLILVGASVPAASADQALRIGLVLQYPVAFQVDDRYAGMAVDVLEEVASKKHWSLSYVAGDEKQITAELERGAIDVAANLPYTPEYQRRFSFGRQDLIVDWSEVLTRAESVDSPSGLDGKRIGAVRSGARVPALRDALARFGVTAEITVYPSSAEVLAALEQKRIDAAALDRLFLLSEGRGLDLHKVPAALAPIGIRYAAGGAGGAEMLQAIDAFLAEAKESGASPYYAIFDRWFPKDREYRLPERVKWGLAVITALLLGLVLGMALRRKAAQKKTAELTARVEDLEREIGEKQVQQGQLQQLAYYDEITSLPNRRLLTERLHEALIDGAAGVCVAMIDLDRFKSFNDTLGHEKGNALLRLVAKRLSASLPADGNVLLCRYGGDEFSILIVGLEPDRCLDLARKALASLEEPISELGMELFVTASIGLSHHPTEAGNISEMLQHADIAMYRAKEEGGATCCLYDADIGKRMIRRMEMETSLRRALINGEMWLEYQPQVDLNTKQVRAVEALLRWRHPHRGLVETSEFIKVAEESGQIISIGEWVMEEVVAQATQWREAGVKPFKIAVNLSSMQVQKRGFVDFVSQLMDEYEFPAQSMELEITENVFIGHGRDTHKVMGRLKDLGISLAIDDFGTGYSALSYLHKFPIDTIKIDKTFVENLHSNPDNQTITSAIVAMGERLNLHTVAECVEETEQVRILSEMRCRAAQGYFFARPLPQDELARWVGKAAA